MSGVLNDCDALLQAAPVRVIPNGLAAQVQAALDAASAAQEDADDALVLLADIASDDKLTPSEKPDLVAKRDAITAEQGGIEAQATSLGVATEKTAYTAAITALTNYLASAPLNGWNTIPGSTISITGTDLRAKFADVYTKRQALLNANTTAAAARAVWANISGNGKPEDGATVGAPAGTTVNGVPVANITAAVTNFNGSNDRNSAALVIPTIATDGSAVDHTIRKDGGADISLEWLWAGAEGDIDGFLVYVYQSTSSFTYTFGSTPALETVYTVPANKRAFILFGAAADLYTTFGVQAYRAVDKDINSAGAVKSPVVKPSLAAENPYRPQANVAFGGDITGTVNGTAVATLLANAAAGKAASDAIAVISDDNVLSKGEKPEAILKWNTVVSEYSALQAQANSLGVSRTAYDTAYTALSSYLTSINSAPAWTDLLVDTPIVGSTFRTKFLDYYTAKQALLNAIAAKAATIADANNILGMQHFRVLTQGGARTDPIPSGAYGIYRNGSAAFGAGRSYNLIRIRRSDGVIVWNKTYDVWASSAAANDLALDLNNSTPDQIVVMYTFDEPISNRLFGALPAAMYRCGASRAVYGSPEFRTRAAYCLIGIPGSGEGNGAEFYQGAIENDPAAWIDVAFTVVNGNYTTKANYTPRTLKDYGYVGDLNATVGAPAGTQVAGVDAATVAAGAQAGNKLTTAFSVSAGGNWSATGRYSVNFGTRTATVTGADNLQSISWAISFDERYGNFYLTGANSQTVGVSFEGPSPGSSATLTVTAYGKDGRVASTFINLDATLTN